jgi:hypothetical protein
MKKVKLHKSELSKPITLNNEGNGVTIGDIEKNKPFKEIINLTINEKQKLVLMRLNMAEDFRICYPGEDGITKQQLIANIKSNPQDDFLIAEITNLTELMDKILERTKPAIQEDLLHEIKQQANKTTGVSKGNFLFGDENIDPFQQGGYKFRMDEVFPLYQELGSIVSLAGNALTRDNFRTQCLIPDCEYVSVFSHGLPTSIEGYNGNIWEIGKYDKNEVLNKIIHLFSCWTAAKLGPDIINNGAQAFFGYIKPFGWYEVLRPHSENHYEVFWNCASSIDVFISMGLTCGEVFEQTKKLYNLWIDYSLEHYPSALVTILIKDRDNLRGPTKTDKTYGDANAVLKSVNLSDNDIQNILKSIMPKQSQVSTIAAD